MLNIIQHLQQEFAQELQLIDQQIEACLELEEPLLNKVGAYMLKGSGKRIRPLLIILWFKFLQPHNTTSLATVAAAIEMMHLTTLLHDDVIDEGELRRSKQTANLIWGNKVAILAGDFLLSQAFNLLITTASLPAVQALVGSAMSMVTGEIKQLSHLNTFIEESTYLKIIEYKTAELFAAASAIAGLTMAQSPEIIKQMQQFGKKFGIIYQITDDLADYCTAEALGKNRGSDFWEGKMTLPIILLTNYCNHQEKTYLKELFCATKEYRTNEHFVSVLKLLDKYQIQQQISQQVQKLSVELSSILDILSSQASIHYLGNFKALVHYVATRVAINNSKAHE